MKDYGFVDYLRSLGTLNEQSIKDDFSRLRSMEKRGIDYRKGPEYVALAYENSDLAPSNKSHFIRVTRRYIDYLKNK